MIHFSDLVSGPNTGGENNAGVIVTLHGRRFGASRGASVVTVGGGAPAAYLQWSDTSISFQLGGAARTGSIVVRTAAGSSNAIPFTVRDGAVYFVGPAGNDANPGTRTQPWATLIKALAAMQPGDTTYLLDGFRKTGDDGRAYQASLTIEKDGQPGRPLAIVAYPGARVVIGGERLFGVRSARPSASWVFAGLEIEGTQYSAFAVSGSDFRLVGNTFRCPGCSTSHGGVNVDAPSSSVLGNQFINIGAAAAVQTRPSHTFNLGGSLSEVAWNTLTENNTCSGIRLHSAAGLHSVRIHDNWISGQRCAGIDLSAINPAAGAIEVRNNVISRAGRGGYSTSWTGHEYVCVVNRGLGPVSATGEVRIEHNTLFDCSSVLNTASEPRSAAFHLADTQPSVAIKLANNIISQPAYVYSAARNAYVSGYSYTANVIADSNLWWGDGPGPAQFAGNVDADPAFLNASALDFHLSPGSPARNAGGATTASLDFEDHSRPAAGADLGALQAGAPLEIASLSCTPASVYRGQTASCQLTLTQPAPAGGSLASLTSSSPALSIPSQLVIPAGQTGATFNAQASSSAPAGAVTVTAQLGVSSRATQLTVLLPPGISTLTCAPNPVVAGAAANCTVTLSAAAPSPGLVVQLTASGTLTMPSSVTVATNLTTAAFPVTTPAVPATFTISASANGSTRSFQLTSTAPPSSTGRSLFVSVTGSDTTGDGSLAKPWLSITKAAAAALPGDTVYLRGGVYAQGVQITVSGLPGKPITIKPYNGETAILDGSNGVNTRGIQLTGKTTSDWVFENLTVRNYTLQAFVGWFTNDRLVIRNVTFDHNGSGIGLFSSNGTRIENVRLLETNGASFDCSPYAGDPGCVDLLVTDTSAVRTMPIGSTAYDAFGIEKGDRVTFRRCLAAGGPGDGFDIKATNALVEHSVAHGNRNNLKFWGDGSIARNNLFYDAVADANVTTSGGPASFTFENNTIVNVSGAGYQFRIAYSAASGVRLTARNNVIVNLNPAVTGTIVHYDKAIVDLGVSNNLYYDPYAAGYAVCGTAACYRPADLLARQWLESGMLYGDPAFVDPSARKFQLKPGSIAIDKGTATGSTLDLSGNPRLYGPAVDIGAYEWRP